MDNDGDFDLLVGDRNGGVWYYENIGTKTDPVLTNRGPLTAGSGKLDVGFNSCPDVADWNGDGLPDLIVGSESYNIWLYLNRGGDGSIPQFEERRLLISSTYLFRSHPRAVDFDNDGIIDLLSGSEYGNVSFLPNTSTDPDNPDISSKLYPIYCDDGTFVRVETRCHIDYADWNNDGYADIIVGEENGDIHVFFNRTAGVDDPSHPPAKFDLRQNFPNPFNPETTLRFDIGAPGRVTLTVFDSRGRLVRVLADQEFSPGRKSVTFNGSELSSGVYVARLTAPGYTKSIKMLLLE